jgi:hypothetical protein
MTAAPEGHFWWFQGATVAELRHRLNGASDMARLEVHPHGDGLTLEVVEPGQDAVARLVPLNESFRCPPVCP